jgi:hypothetical protein
MEINPQLIVARMQQQFPKETQICIQQIQIEMLQKQIGEMKVEVEDE